MIDETQKLDTQTSTQVFDETDKIVQNDENCQNGQQVVVDQKLSKYCLRFIQTNNDQNESLTNGNSDDKKESKFI